MAKAKAKGRARKGNGRRAAGSRQDAIALLKADHREVEQLFAQFEKARDDERKLDLATRVCNALKMHTVIEEEIFYPAFIDATGEEDTHHEAIVEHDGAKKLIAEIEASGPDDDYYDAKVTVLIENVRHHVEEEEDEWFPRVREALGRKQLQEIGAEMEEARKKAPRKPSQPSALKKTVDAVLK